MAVDVPSLIEAYSAVSQAMSPSIDLFEGVSLPLTNQVLAELSYFSRSHPLWEVFSCLAGYVSISAGPTVLTPTAAALSGVDYLTAFGETDGFVKVWDSSPFLTYSNPFLTSSPGEFLAAAHMTHLLVPSGVKAAEAPNGEFIQNCINLYSPNIDRIRQCIKRLQG